MPKICLFPAIDLQFTWVEPPSGRRGALGPSSVAAPLPTALRRSRSCRIGRKWANLQPDGPFPAKRHLFPFFFLIPCCVIRRLNQCSTSKFLVQQHMKYMALQRHINYMTLNYGRLGSARGISPFRRDPMGAGYHRAFLSAMGQAKL